MRRTEQVAGLLVLSLSLFVVSQALRMPYRSEFDRPGSGFFPLWLGIALGILGVLVAVRATMRSAAVDRPAPFQDLRQLRKPGMVLLAMLLAITSLRVLGFLVTIGLVLAFLLVAVERVKPAAGLLTAVLGAVGFYLVFEVWLDVQLPIGVLGI